MHAGLRNGVVATIAAVVITAGAAGVAASVTTTPVSGGPAGAGVCATQASSARTTATVASLRAFGDCEIQRRLVTLSKLMSAVSTSKGLTTADAAALNSKIGAATSELNTLKTSIDAQKMLPALRLDVVQIVTKVRVYQLMGPQVRLTNAADIVIALKAHFDGISTALATRIANAQAKGKDVTAAQAALNAMNTAVASADALAAPLPARLLALTTADFQSTAGPTSLLSARTSILKARDYLKAAATDGRNVLADLK
jgi:hypothetical protein